MPAFLPAEDLARKTEKKGAPKKWQHFYLLKILRGRLKRQGAPKKKASIFACRRPCAEDRKKRRAKKIGSICTCKRPCAKTEKTVVQKLLAEKSTRIFVRTPPKILESLDPPDPPKILKMWFLIVKFGPQKNQIWLVFSKKCYLEHAIWLFLPLVYISTIYAQTGEKSNGLRQGNTLSKTRVISSNMESYRVISSHIELYKTIRFISYR